MNEAARRWLAFADEGEEATTLADMRGRWPEADYVADRRLSGAYARRIFEPDLWRPDTPLKVVFIGTDFEIRVWQTLLKIPFGKVSTYSDIASHLGSPNGARAVGAAVGRNPVSFVVPCHRVLSKSGTLCGYHWGLTRKRAILGWEAGLSAAA
jgi:AraC family transcriptional regulator, regulatory protein of adaptative response / methylated-DNA-[protein]-cysteine methyltransferase